MRLAARHRDDGHRALIIELILLDRPRGRGIGASAGRGRQTIVRITTAIFIDMKRDTRSYFPPPWILRCDPRTAIDLDRD